MDLTSSTSFTYEDISTIMKNKLNHANFEVIDHETRIIDNNVGLLGNHVSLTIKAIVNGSNITEEFKFFAKFFPKHDGPSQFAKETGVFAKEIFAYKIFNEIINSGVYLLRECITNCYYTKDDHVIVLDDLTVDNYVMENKIIVNKEVVELLIRNLAKLHASSLIYEENETRLINEPYRIIDDNEINLEESMYNDKEGFINISGVEASIKGLLTEIDYFEQPKLLQSGNDFKEIVKELCYKIYDFVRPSTKYRNVLTHGDLWSNNFMIKYVSNKPEQCKFIDFQFMRYVPPAQDLLNLIYLTTTRDFRAKYMYELIGYYYATLEKYGKLFGYDMNKIIPFTEFMNSCEEQKLCSLIISSTYFQLILVDGGFLQEFFSDETLYRKTFMEDRSLLVMNYIKNNDNYKERLKESIQDLRDYCVSKNY